MDLKFILSLVVLGIDALTIIVLTVLYIIKQFKKAFKKEGYEEENIELNAINQLVQNIIPKAIEVAEKVKGVPGVVKKNLALGEVMQQCISNDIDYEGHKAFIDEKIEEVIKLTKEVNAKQ